MSIDHCPLCGTGAPAPFLELRDVPALCNALWPSEAEAREAPRGDVALSVCGHCGQIWNRAFDAEVAAYSPAYDNSLHFSGVFQAYAQSLGERLVAEYDLRGKRVVEVGPGSGDFLALLCELGDNEGIGYDPSHDASRAISHPAVRIERAFFPEDGSVEADFAACRHVLEHLEQPRAVARALRSGLAARAGAAYFEVPDGTYMLEQRALWDVIYEHPLYFSEPTLRWMLEGEGFTPTRTSLTFGGQFLAVETRVAEAASAAVAPPSEEYVRAHAETAAAFGVESRALIADWSERLRAMQRDGRVAVWGIGSKGVTFLNLIANAQEIELVVDVSPNKHGKYVPGTGQRIQSPEALRAGQPAHVIVMNPNYLDEITAELRTLGVNAAITPGVDLVAASAG